MVCWFQLVHETLPVVNHRLLWVVAQVGKHLATEVKCSVFRQDIKVSPRTIVSGVSSCCIVMGSTDDLWVTNFPSYPELLVTISWNRILLSGNLPRPEVQNDCRGRGLRAQARHLQPDPGRHGQVHLRRQRHHHRGLPRSRRYIPVYNTDHWIRGTKRDLDLERTTRRQKSFAYFYFFCKFCFRATRRGIERYVSKIKHSTRKSNFQLENRKNGRFWFSSFRSQPDLHIFWQSDKNNSENILNALLMVIAKLSMAAIQDNVLFCVKFGHWRSNTSVLSHQKYQKFDIIAVIALMVNNAAVYFISSLVNKIVTLPPNSPNILKRNWYSRKWQLN